MSKFGALTVSYYPPLSYCFCIYGERRIHVGVQSSVNGQIYVMVGRYSITVFSNQWPTGPPSGRLSEGSSDIFMAEARGRDPTSYQSGTITSQRIDNAYREDHLFLPVLKGQCHKIFSIGFFHDYLPPTP
jgi:hypothetical protein